LLDVAVDSVGVGKENVPWCAGASSALRNSTDLFFLWLRADCRIKNAIIGLQSSNTVSAHMPPTLWQPGQSGNPAGRTRGSRNKLTEEVICTLLRDFRQHGQKAVARVRREQPGVYLRVLALLCPREHQVQHSNPLKDLTDEQLEAMIEYIETSLAAQAGGPVKVIEGTTTAPPALEPPKRKPNRLMMEVDTAIGRQERKPRKRVPSPASA
jgi:hypothetical protein